MSENLTLYNENRDDSGIVKEEKKSGIAVIDIENPRSVINLVSGRVRERLLLVEEKFFYWKERTLEKKAMPEDMDYQIKMSFWNEYFYCADNNKPSMRINHVIKGLCSESYFFDSFLMNKYKAAWLIFPPTNYTLQMQHILDKGLKVLAQVMRKSPIDDVTGKLDSRLLEKQIAIFKMVDARLKGAVMQRLQVTQKSVNLNMNQDVDKNMAMSAAAQITGIDDELSKIDMELKQLEQNDDDDFETSFSVKEVDAEAVEVDQGE